MASEVDICNIALSMIGDRGNVITIAPAEKSIQAQESARFYPIARDEILACGVAWNFATLRAVLALVSSAAPPQHLPFTFQQPDGCVKVVGVWSPTSSVNTTDGFSEPFLCEAGDDGSPVIYSVFDDSCARYVKRITDTSRFPPGFITCVATQLASYLTGPIVKGRNGVALKAELLKELHMVCIPKAAAAEASQNITKFPDFDPENVTARA